MPRYQKTNKHHPNILTKYNEMKQALITYQNKIPTQDFQNRCSRRLQQHAGYNCTQVTTARRQIHRLSEPAGLDVQATAFLSCIPNQQEETNTNHSISTTSARNSHLKGNDGVLCYTPATVRPFNGVLCYTPATVRPFYDVLCYTPATVRPFNDVLCYTPTTVRPFNDVLCYTPTTVRPFNDVLCYTPATVRPFNDVLCYTPATVRPFNDAVTVSPIPTIAF